MPDAEELALRALRHRDRSRRELDQRLERAGIAAEERSRALDELTASGLVSDARYAETRAEALAGRGASDALIRRDLRRAGIDHAAVEHAIGNLEAEDARAATVFERRGGGPRALRYLAAKGFGPDTLDRLTEADALQWVNFIQHFACTETLSETE